MANTGFSSARSMICPRPASIAMGFLAVLLVMILATPGRAQTFTVLHAFTNIDGAQASGSLLRDDDGNLYGSASYGGDLSCDNGEGCGTIFKLDSAGNMTVLHAFSLGTDGGVSSGSSVARCGWESVRTYRRGNIQARYNQYSDRDPSDRCPEPGASFGGRQDGKPLWCHNSWW